MFSAENENENVVILWSYRQDTVAFFWLIMIKALVFCEPPI